MPDMIDPQRRRDLMAHTYQGRLVLNNEPSPEHAEFVSDHWKDQPRDKGKFATESGSGSSKEKESVPVIDKEAVKKAKKKASIEKVIDDFKQFWNSNGHTEQEATSLRNRLRLIPRLELCRVAYFAGVNTRGWLPEKEIRQMIYEKMLDHAAGKSTHQQDPQWREKRDARIAEIAAEKEEEKIVTKPKTDDHAAKLASMDNKTLDESLIKLQKNMYGGKAGYEDVDSPLYMVYAHLGNFRNDIRHQMPSGRAATEAEIAELRGYIDKAKDWLTDNENAVIEEGFRRWKETQKIDPEVEQRRRWAERANQVAGGNAWSIPLSKYNSIAREADKKAGYKPSHGEAGMAHEHSLMKSNRLVHKSAVELALADGRDVPKEVLAEYPDLAKKVKKPEPKPSGWHANREPVFAAMRKLDDEVQRHYKTAQDLGPRHGTLSVGSADFDHQLKAGVGEEYLRTLRKGGTPDEALAAASKFGGEMVKKWNTSGSKGRVTISSRAELQRWEGSGQAEAENIHRQFLNMLPDDAKGT